MKIVVITGSPRHSRSRRSAVYHAYVHNNLLDKMERLEY